MKLSSIERDMLKRANKRYEDQRDLKYVKWEAIEASEAFKEAVKGRIWKW